jgi:hypothetical protein
VGMAWEGGPHQLVMGLLCPLPGSPQWGATLPTSNTAHHHVQQTEIAANTTRQSIRLSHPTPGAMWGPWLKPYPPKTCVCHVCYVKSTKGMAKHQRTHPRQAWLCLRRPYVPPNTWPKWVPEGMHCSSCSSMQDFSDGFSLNPNKKGHRPQAIQHPCLSHSKFQKPKGHIWEPLMPMAGACTHPSCIAQAKGEIHIPSPATLIGHPCRPTSHQLTTPSQHAGTISRLLKIS